MYCHECGDEVPESAGICPSCGATLTVEPTAESEPNERTAPDEPDQESEPPDQPPAGHHPSPETDTEPETADEPAAQQPSDPAGGKQRSPGTPGQREPGDPAGQPSGGAPRQQPARPGQSGPPPHEAGTEPTQGQPPGTQHPQGGGPQQGRGQPPRGGQPQGGQPQRGGQPPQGGQQQSPTQPVQGRPGGQAGRPGQPAPAGGPGGGYGGGFDLDRLRATLPLVSGGIAGAVVGAVMFVLGIGITLAYPDGLSTFFDSTLGSGAATALDLHFGTPQHIVPGLFGNFETFQAGEATFGFLYLLAPLLLYQTAKLISDSNRPENASLTTGVLTGATVTLGYLPVVLLAAVLVPADLGWDFSLVTAVVLAGLVYPLVFGGLGGFVSWYFEPSERKAGTSYGTLAFVGVLIGLFATSYIYMDVPELVEVGTLDRLLASFVVFAQVHGFSVNEGVGTAAIPYLVTALIIGFVGFVRVRRSNYVRSLTDAFAKGTTPAVAYLTLFGLFTSLTVVTTSSFVIEDLELGRVFVLFARSFSQEAVASIGEYVNLMLVGTIVYPVIVGGAGGALAWWLESRDRAPATNQQAPRNPPQ
ncbi:hypothetical protein [Halorhabdus sp. CUG00001]|uniref:zinc-ribbon domain-containing protein n=1 Tax=Halorhabdus sp. CUG00001 TaxID=2600297 RepID=UPI00131ACDB4|nr:hypothetical protein [Halorhabdus sp. CUG00001]